MPKGFNDLNHILSHSIPMVLIEATREPIRSRCPRRRNLRDRQYDFSGSHRANQCIVILRCDPGFNISHNIVNLIRTRRLKQVSKKKKSKRRSLERRPLANRRVGAPFSKAGFFSQKRRCISQKLGLLRNHEPNPGFRKINLSRRVVTRHMQLAALRKLRATLSESA
ncbi:hypothetical protein ACFX10_026730 [Malus domestica]